MKVRKGFSTEYAKNKFDVEVDEADLTRMLAEHQIPPELAPRVTVLMAFRLQWLMLTEAVKVSQEYASRLGPARTAYYATADAVRKELGLEPAYAAFLAPQQPAEVPG